MDVRGWTSVSLEGWLVEVRAEEEASVRPSILGRSQSGPGEAWQGLEAQGERAECSVDRGCAAFLSSGETWFPVHILGKIIRRLKLEIGGLARWPFSDVPNVRCAGKMGRRKGDLVMQAAGGEKGIRGMSTLGPG